jgi:hypothetical protein
MLVVALIDKITVVHYLIMINEGVNDWAGCVNY